MKLVDHRTLPGGEGDMRAVSDGRRLAIDRRLEAEQERADPIIGRVAIGAEQAHSKNGEDRIVKGAGPGEVIGAERDVMNHLTPPLADR